MARAISVKVATAKVIKSLEAKVLDNAKVLKDNEAKRIAHAKQLATYHKSILKDFGSQLEIENVNTRWNGQIEVQYKKLKDFDLPEQPKLELENELSRWDIEEIENAIRILKMTDEEVVNASTFKNIAKYL